jgi:hypothetical protein
MSIPADIASIASAPPGARRDRSDSATSNNDLRPVKSGSAFAKSGSSLKPPDGKKAKKSRRMSASSKNGIAAALAKGGLALAHGHTHTPNGEPIMSLGSTKSAPSSRRGSKRNPYLKSSHRPDGEGGSDAGLEFDDEEEEDDDDDESDYEAGLPVTGFAVASNRRNAEFHSMFPAVDEGDYLIEGELWRKAFASRGTDRQIMDVRYQRISWYKDECMSLRTIYASTPTSLAGSPM